VANQNTNDNPLKIEIPRKILNKIATMNKEIEALLLQADAKLTKSFKYTFRFHLVNSAPLDILTKKERSAFLSFELKYRGTPNYVEPEVVTDGKEFHLANIDLARHVLNEWRPIIFNKKDPVYFGRVHNIIAKMLVRKHPSEGSKITVETGREPTVERTVEYLEYMGQCRDILVFVLDNLDLDYLYNGVLQHADSRFFERYEKDNHSGNLNYVLMKHAFIVSQLREYLKPYHLCASIFWIDGYPRSGGLE